MIYAQKNISVNRISLYLAMVFIAMLLLFGCDKNVVYEKNHNIDNYSWTYDDIKSFEVELADTTEKYNLYINIRHAHHYGWQNIWVKVSTQFPDGNITTEEVSLPLAENSGKWHGDCMGDVCDMPVLIQHQARIKDPGTYTFFIEQSMRENPLPGIMSVGLRVERSEDESNG